MGGEVGHCSFVSLHYMLRVGLCLGVSYTDQVSSVVFFLYSVRAAFLDILPYFYHVVKAHRFTQL